MQFQLDGVRALLARDRILLADDMGLGKTVQAIAAIRILCIQRTIESVLIVVPASLIDQWRRELYRWAPELRLIAVRGSATDRAWQWRAAAHVTIVSYETLRSDSAGGPGAPSRRKLWDIVVLDEAQKIKNRDVEISRAAKQLRRKRSWALTGTPLENGLDDLASILEFVDQGDEVSTKKYVPGPELLARHQQLQLRRRKSDVLDQLPPKQVIAVGIPLLPGQQQSYARAEQQGVFRLRELGQTIRIEHVLELITRLKQICNADPETGESAKFLDIRERMATLSEEGHRALLFSQYTDNSFGVGAIEAALEDFQPLTYTGGMSGPERDRTIQQFKSDSTHQALILSLRAGGVGLNLQEASYVFHVDRWWNPAVERQAEDRTHRMGQIVPVTVFKYTCEGTIEERIQGILAAKQQIFDEIIDDVSLDVASRLTRDELFGLLGLEAPLPVEGRRARPTGLELEERCAMILRAKGWSVDHTPRSRDGGVDLIATRYDEIGLEQKIYVQCKDHARAVGVEVVRELLGVIPAGATIQAVLASPSGITADAARLARERNVRIWDEAALLDLESSA
jgi:SNF2 family DNA or RNA helicase